MNRLIAFLILCSLIVGCNSPEPRLPVSVKSGSFIEASVKRNKSLLKKEQMLLQNLMDSNDSINYIASESGFWYHYNTKIAQDTIRPGFGDIVNFDYTVKDIAGINIYTETDIEAKDYAMDKEELFTGLREGLKLMKPGETVTFLFPSQKAYGYYGDSNKIGANIPLICKVTVYSIIQNPEK